MEIKKITSSGENKKKNKIKSSFDFNRAHCVCVLSAGSGAVSDAPCCWKEDEARWLLLISFVFLLSADFLFFCTFFLNMFFVCLNTYLHTVRISGSNQTLQVNKCLKCSK